jgi:hypothetical protein
MTWEHFVTIFSLVGEHLRASSMTWEHFVTIISLMPSSFYLDIVVTDPHEN